MRINIVLAGGATVADSLAVRDFPHLTKSMADASMIIGQRNTDFFIYLPSENPLYTNILIFDCLIRFKIAQQERIRSFP